MFLGNRNRTSYSAWWYCGKTRFIFGGTAKSQRVLKRSVQYAFDHPKSAREYIRCYAQEMDEQVMYEHIKLYVNDFSLDLGVEGKQAVEEVFKRNGIQTNDIFVL